MNPISFTDFLEQLIKNDNISMKNKQSQPKPTKDVDFLDRLRQDMASMKNKQNQQPMSMSPTDLLEQLLKQDTMKNKQNQQSKPMFPTDLLEQLLKQQMPFMKNKQNQQSKPMFPTDLLEQLLKQEMPTMKNQQNQQSKSMFPTDLLEQLLKQEMPTMKNKHNQQCDRPSQSCNWFEKPTKQTSSSNTKSSFSLCVADRDAHPNNVYHFEVESVSFIIRVTHDFNWNGYVFFPIGHPDCGKSIKELNSLYKVHNGMCFKGDDYIGFFGCDDDDYCYTRDGANSNKSYRSFDKIKSQTAKLAHQVADRCTESKSSCRTEEEELAAIIDFLETLVKPTRAYKPTKTDTPTVRPHEPNFFDFASSYRPTSTPDHFGPTSSASVRPDTENRSSPFFTLLNPNNVCDVSDEKDCSSKSILEMLGKFGFDNTKVVKSCNAFNAVTPCGKGLHPVDCCPNLASDNKSTDSMPSLESTNSMPDLESNSSMSNSESNTDSNETSSDTDNRNTINSNSDDDDSDNTESPHNSNQTPSNPDKTSNLEDIIKLRNLNYCDLRALDLMFPGVLDNIANLKEGDKLCICGKCNEKSIMDELD